MNELLNDFERLKPNQKFAIIIFAFLTLAIYPQSLIIVLMAVVIFILIKNLPSITENYNKGKNETENKKSIIQIIKEVETPDETNFCPICGLTTDVNANYCRKCGFKIK